MQVLRLADLTVTRWKNGGGTTREYAVHPADADVNSFFWRISRARIDHHVAFSSFPDIDRTLTVVAGDDLDLLFYDRRIRLDRTTPPYRFRGEANVDCRIPSGPIEDLNVMTRRGHWTHDVARRRIGEATTVALDGDHGMVFAVDAVRVESDGHAPVDLGHGDCVVFDRPAEVRLAPTGASAEFLTVRLAHVARPVV
jgi:environmental stress-induced protein Ves